MSRLSLLREYVLFLRERRKYWMLPIFLLFLLLGTLVVLLEGSAIAPFIYAVF